MCELCDLVNSGKGFLIGTFVLAKCKTCDTPMLVYIRHSKHPEPEQIDLVTMKIKEVFGEKTKFRFEMRSITDHFHFHVLLGGGET